ncbi:MULTISPECIES: nuclear transport factor 2 family protein [Rhodococcus]|uniref:nuclear transport factor 2 family protein n=1 Tax=Rhodococcus TaxID=1827 RepID=UPI001E5EBFF5|nr:nuclear transport factor 2 family protein [Rhodococcus sp. JT-3]WCT00851.1 nuclear transport factor 2 family protein [Rhodococcus qingshengii]
MISKFTAPSSENTAAHWDEAVVVVVMSCSVRSAAPTSTEDSMQPEGPAEQIRSTLARIAHLADTGSVENYVEQFTREAEWNMPANPDRGIPAQVRRGREEIAAGVVERRAAGIQGPGTFTRHVTTAIAVDVTSETTARADAVWTFYVDTTTSPKLSGVGSYADEFELEDGRWRLSRRVISRG